VNNRNKIILKGQLKVPGDKSISHRALIFSTFVKGTNKIWNLSPAHDVNSTINCLQALGLEIQMLPGNIKGLSTTYHSVLSNGIESIRQPSTLLFAGNSGTTMRLLSGLVAGLPFTFNFDGDASLRKRPMARVLDPLKAMGAIVEYKNQKNHAPFSMVGSSLKGSSFELPVASAQIQTALLLAGLQANGETTVELPATVRDHTQRLFKYLNIPFKVQIKMQEEKNFEKIVVTKLTKSIEPFEINVPADISSAAFFMVAASCLKNSEIELLDVGMNPGRILIVEALKKMGANISIEKNREESGEPIANVRVRGNSLLQGISINGSEIASGIDELPILALAGAFSKGQFSVRDAEELRVKESDRISAIVQNLKLIGADVEEVKDGFDIQGKTSLAGGCIWKSYGDHRLAMTGLIANLLCDQPVQIDDLDCVSISYPNFVRDLEYLRQ
jgi:3-phosphoshikimate 1-carboxyvinyltransferase